MISRACSVVLLVIGPHACVHRHGRTTNDARSFSVGWIHCHTSLAVRRFVLLRRVHDHMLFNRKSLLPYSQPCPVLRFPTMPCSEIGVVVALCCTLDVDLLLSSSQHDGFACVNRMALLMCLTLEHSCCVCVSFQKTKKVFACEPAPLIAVVLQSLLLQNEIATSEPLLSS
jgi:hypothetical protein